MKVKELIAELQKLDPEMPVHMVDTWPTDPREDEEGNTETYEFDFKAENAVWPNRNIVVIA